MFDIGFWEITLIAVVALLVVGPDRLPALARTVGLWVGKIRRMVAQVKDDVERELRADEIRRMLDKPEEFDDVEKTLKETREGLNEASRDLSRNATDADTDTGSRDPASSAATRSSDSPTQAPAPSSKGQTPGASAPSSGGEGTADAPSPRPRSDESSEPAGADTHSQDSTSVTSSDDGDQTSRV